MDKHVLNNKIVEIMYQIDQIQNERWKQHCRTNNEMEQLVEEYLKEYPQDTEMWLKLTFIEYHQLHDYLRAIECVKRILAYDPNNAYAAVLLTVLLDFNMVVDEESFNILCAVKTEDNEYKAMIEYAKALHFEDQKSLDHYYKAEFYWRLHVKEFLSKYVCEDHSPTLDERVQANLEVLCKGYPKAPYDSLSVERFLNEFVRRKI